MTDLTYAQATRRYERLRAPLTAVDLIRVGAEHEAAHAVVAVGLGLDVGEVVVTPDGGGHTDLDHRGDVAHQAATLIAPMVWFDAFRADEWPRGDVAGCRDDIARLRGMCGPMGATTAGHTARRVLAERADDVMELARRLVVERRIDYGQGRARVSRRTAGARVDHRPTSSRHMPAVDLDAVLAEIEREGYAGL